MRPGCGAGGGSYGGLGANGLTECANAGMFGSLRGNFYGTSAMDSLLGGSGGGAGGNAALIAIPPVPFPNLVSHAGGAGGAGGGVLGLECAGTFTLGAAGRILMNGGNGGPGGGPAGSNGGDGGGGSGGGLKLQALIAILHPSALIRALGGQGRPGGLGQGGAGRVRLEDQDGALNQSVSNPAPSVAALLLLRPGRTVGQSRFYDTGRPNPIYVFDGSEPKTGRALGNTNDLTFAELPTAAQSVTITFQGAPPDPANPAQPDPDPGHWFPPQAGPGSAIPFETDIGELSARNLRFVRFRVEFDIGPPVPTLPSRPSIESLRIRTQ
jgi:hypothetical protein